MNIQSQDSTNTYHHTYRTESGITTPKDKAPDMKNSSNKRFDMKRIKTLTDEEFLIYIKDLKKTADD